MNITIQSLDFRAGDALRNFIAEKVGKLFRHSDRIIRAEVVLRRGNNGNLQNRLCEIRLIIPGHDHFVSKSTDGYEKSILESVRTLQKILRNSKPSKVLRGVKDRFRKIIS